ncbi:MAG: radical SAM protein [Nitrospirae bacterium]|nr:radical SAM protein [Nitrospirota bacterium]
MKISFLSPPALDGKPAADRLYGCAYSFYYLPHIPSLMCATILRDNGYKIELLDFPAQKKGISEFTGYIKSTDADIFVFYSVFLTKRTDIKAREIIRQFKPGARFIYMGPYPTAFPLELIDDREDTVVVRGEPELTTLKLIKAIESGSLRADIENIVFRNGKDISYGPIGEFIEDIDSLPIPDRRLLDHSVYFNSKMKKSPQTVLLTSRGCSFRCWYCFPNSLSYVREAVHKGKYGRKPPVKLMALERIEKELKEISDMGFKAVSVMDDNFIWGEERTLKLCGFFKKYDLEWSCLARVDLVTEPIIKAMKESNCTYVDFGIESFDPDVLKCIKKDLDIEKAKTTIKLMQRHGVEPEVNILIGSCPTEKKESIKKTVNAVEELKIHYVLYSIASPFPGTELYEAAKREGWLIGGEYSLNDAVYESVLSYPQLTKKDMEGLIAWAYRRHYFSPHFLLKELKSLTSITELLSKLRTGLIVFKKYVLGLQKKESGM